MDHEKTSVVMTALMPHPPIVVRGVGRGREREAARTVEAMTRLAERIVDARPDVLVVISPHTPRVPRTFALWNSPRIAGSFAQFRAPEERIDLPNDMEFVAQLKQCCTRRGIRTRLLDDGDLDHGALVPLVYLRDAGWNGPTVVAGLNYPGEGQLESFGEAIRESASALNCRCVVLASGDMSHRLIPEAPGGFHPDAHKFDAAFVQCIESDDIARLRQFDERLREIAGEDVVDSTVVALAAGGFRMMGARLFSYEGPFGVGYTVALLNDESCDRTPLAVSPPDREAFPLAATARRAVEAYLVGRRSPPPHEIPDGLRRSAGVFVTIRTLDDELRGCIGTLFPQYDDVVRETMDRAIAAATQDPRFPPVEASEMRHLKFEVSVLGPSEEVRSTNDLDPTRYGVVVSNERGKRAVMLPGIESLDTVEKQLAATKQKAGIPPDAGCRIERFEVEKYLED